MIGAFAGLECGVAVALAGSRDVAGGVELADPDQALGNGSLGGEIGLGDDDAVGGDNLFAHFRLVVDLGGRVEGVERDDDGGGGEMVFEHRVGRQGEEYGHRVSQTADFDDDQADVARPPSP